jgi:hypothetical protein
LDANEKLSVTPNLNFIFEQIKFYLKKL